ncbi:MAG: DNA mismatch repair endonuclease MutL, partial [Pseudomonadota bacterium]
MNALDRNIKTGPPPIRRLTEAVANRIAAGEVVERPASAVKELVENALDAGARQIAVDLAEGGRALIRVSDDGHGIAADALPLAVERHATSKLADDDLVNIHGFGFRGEALASLAAVARLTLTSRPADADSAAEVVVAGTAGAAAPRPAARTTGTTVTVEDLFFATPARLKFLRSARAEGQAVADQLRRLAMTAPAVAFTLSDVTDPAHPRTLIDLPACSGTPEGALKSRLKAIMGAQFTENALPVLAERDGFHLSGLAALPTYSRGNASAQFLFVNGRPVRDRLLGGALRAAYIDALPKDRHGVVALFLAVPPEAVDVNVHPAKAEVRFREPGVVRGLIIGAIRHALAEAGLRTASTVTAGLLGAERSPPPPNRIYQMDRPSQTARHAAHAAAAPS